MLQTRYFSSSFSCWCWAEHLSLGGSWIPGYGRTLATSAKTNRSPLALAGRRQFSQDVVPFMVKRRFRRRRGTSRSTFSNYLAGALRTHSHDVLHCAHGYSSAARAAVLYGAGRAMGALIVTSAPKEWLIVDPIDAG